MVISSALDMKTLADGPQLPPSGFWAPRDGLSTYCNATQAAHKGWGLGGLSDTAGRRFINGSVSCVAREHERAERGSTRPSSKAPCPKQQCAIKTKKLFDDHNCQASLMGRAHATAPR